MLIYFTSTARPVEHLSAFTACKSITLSADFRITDLCFSRLFTSKYVSLVLADQSVRLTIASTSRPMAPDLAAAWHALIAPVPREVTADQLAPLQRLLPKLLDATTWSIDRADVLRVNGKLVLRILAYCTTTQTQRYDFYADTDDSGQFLESFQFESPAAHYETLLAHAHITLNTAVWNDVRKEKLLA